MYIECQAADRQSKGAKRKKKQAEWIVTTRERWECVKLKQVNESAANRSLLILNSFSNQFLVILRFQSK